MKRTAIRSGASASPGLVVTVSLSSRLGRRGGSSLNRPPRPGEYGCRTLSALSSDGYVPAYACGGDLTASVLADAGSQSDPINVRWVRGSASFTNFQGGDDRDLKRPHRI
jgi:hypothetical protein